MAKKKRQGDPSRDRCESTDSEDGGGLEDRPLASCPHVGKAANLAAVKKTLKIAWVKVGQCTQCNKENKVVSPVKKLERDPRLRKELGGKLSLAEIKKEQLERAKAEQRAAAEKLKKEREQKERQAEEAAKEEEAKKNEASEKKDEDTPEGATKEEVPKKVELPSIWLCLKCGSQGCANNEKKHSFAHYKAPRSDLHSLVVNIASWSIWCYECQLEIYVDSHKKLYEAVEYIKKVKEQGVKQVTVAPKGNAAFGTIQPLALGRALTGGSSSGSATYTKGGLLRIKGLSNLGNTCFFNSVMQCLNQTHLLTHLLDLQAAKGVSLEVPGFEAGAASTNDDSEASDAEPDKIFESFAGLSVQLAEGGPMVTSLANFFKEMHNTGKTATFSPGHLFTQVVRQAPKFRGMQQQDSHELLRYLLDGLRGEEQRRQKSAILKHFGLTEKTDPKSVARSLRRKLQVYGRQANHTLLDRIFSGQLVSTIVCEECHHSSRRYEQFLDISLPVVEDAPRHKPSPKRTHAAAAALPDDGEGKVTCCGVREERKSKSLAKKEKERRRKEKRNKGRKNSSHRSSAALDAEEDGELQGIREELQGTEKFEAAEQERPPEDPEDVRVITSTGFHRQESIDLGTWKDKGGEEEEGYEEGEEEGQPETEEDWEWDYGETHEDKQTVKPKNAAKLDAKAEESDYIDTSEHEVTFKHEDDDDREKSSEKTAENSDEDVNSQMDEDVEEEEETGASSNGDVEDNDEDDVNKKWVVDKNYLSNLKMLDDLMNVTSNLDPRMALLCRGMAGLSTGRARRQAERERVEAEWTARTLATLAPRYQATPGECSIYSCLNSFTQSELLTGSNKWACDRCTELRDAAGNPENSESGGGKGKPTTVYSSASKQMLVFSPPAVLTLQLKRFQQTISGCKKVNKHVAFPLDLDLAAFCSSTCVAMPNIELGGKVAYSLYGVVEHSGSLRGGHYVAYVKARPTSRLAGKEAFFNPPLAKPGDVPSFLAEIDRKLRKNTAAVKGDLKAKEAKVAEDVAADETNNNTVPNTSQAAVRKWFFVSDSSVSEVAEDKVLRSQAYLLFYERTL